MSAFSIGAQTSTKDAQSSELVPNKASNSSVPGIFVKWIPGETVTFYTAILGLGVAQGALTGEETPEELLARIDAGSPAWFWVAFGLSVALVLMGALTEKDADKKLSFTSLTVRCLLALASFTIWASAIPGAWPYSWHFIRDMGAAYALLLVPVAVIFTGLAELLTKKLKV